MTYPILWDTERVREVFTTESRQKVRTLFMQTHRPFQRIKVDFCKEQGTQNSFISEEHLLAIIQERPLDAHNRLFFVVGEAGSGKSELCQWLEYTADGARSLVIHIPRSMTSAAHVVALLRHALDDGSAGLQHTPLATQAEYIALSAVVLLYEQRSTSLAPADRWVPLLTGAEMRRHITDHLAAAASGSYHGLLTNDKDVADFCALAGITSAPDELPTVASDLRRLLERAMEQALWLGDLRALLTRLGDRAIAQGRRPLLLLEDITAFQILGDRLLDYLLDLTSGHFDAVIGVTTGFERTQIAGATLAGDLTHIHHRLRARLVLTDEQGRSYGLEDDLVELSRAYLRAVQPRDAPASQRALYDTVFGADLYPLTETALRRAFSHLHEEGNPRQTPRLFLEHVLGAALRSPDIPPLTLDRAAHLRQPPPLFRSDEVRDERLHSLLRWYGEVSDETVTLDERIPALWGIPVPPQMRAGGRVRVARAYISQPPRADDISQDWQEELRELQRWLTSGGLYPQRETLKRGIERVILALGDPRALGSRSALSVSRAEVYYARGDERLPISLGRGSGDQPGGGTYVKVDVTGAAEERQILEELTYLSLSGAELSRVCQNAPLTLDWAQGHWDAYHSDVRALLTTRLGGMSIEDVIWLGWRWVCSLADQPWDDHPHLRPLAAPAPSEAAISPWSPAQHSACHVAGETLLTAHETLRRLFIGAFTLCDTLLDRDRCSAVAQMDTAGAMQRLAQLALPALRALPFKVRPMGQSLYDLLAPLHRYALALTQIDIDRAIQSDLADLERREAQLVSESDADQALLQSQLDALRWRCGEVGLAWRETWEKAVETLARCTPDDLAILRATIQRLRDDTSERERSHGFDLWDYQEFRRHMRPLVQHPYWSAVELVQDIQRQLIQRAKARYRRDGRVLTGTPSYRALLQTVRALQKDLADELPTARHSDERNV